MADPLWTAKEAAKATGGKATGKWTATGLSIDTRSLNAGDMFIALKDQRDGHDFLDVAYEAGASAALVSKDAGRRPSLKVDDTLAGLEALGLAARARCKGAFAAVTGSVGKTSVKEMLAQIFRAVGRAHWSERSFNNHWGVPLTLARMPKDTERAIFEIGMNTPGEIAPRSRMVRPHVAMVTKIAGAHLEGMGRIEAIALEKSDIYAGLEPSGAAIIPADDNFADFLADRAKIHQPRCKIYEFGGSAMHGAKLSAFDLDGDGSKGVVDLLGETVSFHLNARGAHWGANACLALLAAKLAGVKAGDAAAALEGFGPPEGRGAAVRLALPSGGEAVMLDDSYNANPESMRAAFKALKLHKGRRLAALGEMRELGKDAAALHASLAQPIRDAGVEEVFLIGKDMDYLAAALREGGNQPGVTAVSSESDMVEAVNKSLKNGDVLLIKGSNASGMGRVGRVLVAEYAEGVGLKKNAAEPVAGIDHAG